MNMYRVAFRVLSFSALSLTLAVFPSASASRSLLDRIETVAGTGQSGFGGDGGPAALAQFGTIQGLAKDSSGNLYVSDVTNHRVRRIERNGIVITVAGTGVPGYNGDQRSAATAQLATPAGMALDAVGNLYIADLGNHRIRRIDRTGTIRTFAGNGVRGFRGDGGLATEASFSYPSDIVFDAFGNCFVTDVGNYRVRRIDPSGLITTVAGNGLRAYAGDGGPATAASFRDVVGIAATSMNGLLIVDRFSHRVRQMDSSGTITTFAGNGVYGYSADDIPAVQASFRLPQDVAVDQFGNAYIADFFNHRIRMVDSAGIITTIAGSGSRGFGGDGGPAIQAVLNGPTAVAVDSANNVYFADSFNYRVRVIRPVN
jgi:sugar lactone lactonase YvrE